MGLAAINTNYAIPARLSPTKDALFHEDQNSPYANLVVIREDEKDAPWVAKLLAAIQSPEVRTAAMHIFAEQALPAWTQTK